MKKPLLSLLLSILSSADAFGLMPGVRIMHRRFAQVCMNKSDNDEVLDISQMRLREIQAELRDKWQVSYDDCFDRESLVQRLENVRTQNHAPRKTNEDDVDTDPLHEIRQENKGNMNNSTFDREHKREELSKLRVAELRKELGARNIRWANMIEKRDLVNALLDAMEASTGFSVSGAITPGEVADLNANQLKMELSSDNSASTPLLLDVYAVWCGPCQMMAPQLVEAAKELGSTCRVAKIDSDKYGEWAQKLNVGALPTVIVFGSNGEELTRQEGAVMSNALINMVKPHL